MGLNSPVRDGKFEFTVTGQDCSQKTLGDQYLSTTAQGIYCVVSMHVANIGREAQSFDETSQKALDTKHLTYSPDVNAAEYMPNSNSWFEQLNPGSAIDAQVVYDVPVGTKLIQLELHDSAFSGGVTVNLG